MSNLEREAVPTLCGGRDDVLGEPVRELLPPRRVRLGESTEVRRLLPSLGRRMIGAWAFVDHYGPDDIADEPGMQVPPHPHIGLQTVSWLHQGEVLHRDSTGSRQTIRPREVGLMTSGRAISHSEESPRPHARFPHGAQLWIALPDAHRHVDPHFEHHAALPVVTAPGLTGTVVLGEVDGTRSPGTTYSPLVGLDVSLTAGAEPRLPLDPDFEYGVLTMSGELHADGVPPLPRLPPLPGLRPHRTPLARGLGRLVHAPGRRALRGEADHVVELRRADDAHGGGAELDQPGAFPGQPVGARHVAHQRHGLGLDPVFAEGTQVPFGQVPLGAVGADPHHVHLVGDGPLQVGGGAPARQHEDGHPAVLQGLPHDRQHLVVVEPGLPDLQGGTPRPLPCPTSTTGTPAVSAARA